MTATLLVVRHGRAFGSVRPCRFVRRSACINASSVNAYLLARLNASPYCSDMKTLVLHTPKGGSGKNRP